MYRLFGKFFQDGRRVELYVTRTFLSGFHEFFEFSVVVYSDKDLVFIGVVSKENLSLVALKQSLT